MNSLLKHSAIGIFALSAALMASGCAKDPAAGGNATDDRPGEIFLRIELPDPLPVDPMTRVGAADFNEIRDLNVVVASGRGDDAALSAVHYIDVRDIPVESGDPTVQYNGENIEIHFSDSEWYTSSTGVYVVANYGRKIAQGMTVGQVRSLTQTSSMPGIPENGCLMFAEAATDPDNPSHSHGDGTTGANMVASLERTVAMITVEVDGTRLNRNVAIIPRSISLHRVPDKCFIGRQNVVTVTSSQIPADEIGVVTDGETKGERGELDWGTIVGQATLDSDTNPWSDAMTKVGGHYDGTDYSDPDIDPLFMFENWHGGDSFGAADTGETGKRPADCPENASPEQIHSDPSTATCSYLDFEAYYVRMNDKGDNSLFSGTVHFRLFLGDDIQRNFDILRNRYYKITLQLSGYAVTEGGQVDSDGNLVVDNGNATWRVDSYLGEASFETGDVILNGSGEYFPIDVNASENVTCTIEGNNQDTQFLWIYNSSQGGMWSSVAGSVKATVSNKSIWLYAEPWSEYAGGFDSETHSRKHTVTLKVYRGSSATGDPIETRTIDVVQYAPIEYTASDPYIEEVFGKPSVKLLIDRVDRSSMPWGFDGEHLDYNQNDAFQNTAHLIDAEPWVSDPNHPHHSHRDRAAEYLPWGKQNGGSAMIYSISFWNMPSTNPDLDIDEILNNPTFPDLDHSTEWTNNYWTLPSIAGWQIIEKAYKAGALDPNHPVLPYMQYWTSNAVTEVSGIDDGATNAYTYQFGKGLDALKESDVYPTEQIRERTEKLRFRLIAVDPSTFN